PGMLRRTVRLGRGAFHKGNTREESGRMRGSRLAAQNQQRNSVARQAFGDGNAGQNTASPIKPSTIRVARQARMTFSWRVSENGMASEAEIMQPGKHFLQQGVAGKIGPGMIAGDTDEKLRSPAFETVVPGEAEQLARRAGIPVGQRSVIVDVPEPDVLGKVSVAEQARFCRRQPPPAH